MQRGPSISLDAVDEGSVVESSPVPHFSAAAFANHTYPVLPSELLIRNANFTVRVFPCASCCVALCKKPLVHIAAGALLAPGAASALHRFQEDGGRVLE